MTLETLRRLYKHYTETKQLGKAEVMAGKAMIGYKEDITEDETKSKSKK